MRVPLIAGNWKMNNTIEESLKLASELVKFANSFDENREILICAPYTALYALKSVVNGTKIKLGAQNMYFEESGAYTGEISPVMLKDIGVEYVLIGHSERRHCFNEYDILLNKKIKAALKYGIKPILCVGETLEEREAGVEYSVVKDQIVNGLDGIDHEDIKRVCIAYEPVWAIGTGKTASSNQANEIISYIRSIINELYCEEVSDNIIIQYGGSVKGSNAGEIMAQSDIDGALVGGASLKADEFIKIINY